MALRALDGSTACQFKTTLKVVPGADDTFAMGCWVRPIAYEPLGSVSARLFHWRTQGNWDATQAQIITGSDDSPSVYWGRRSVANIAAPNLHSGACDSLWRFSIFRAVSAANHRAVTITPTGQLYSVSSATDVSALDTTTINELVFGWDTASAAKCDIAEFWICAADPFKGMTDVPRDLMYHIAYNGPLSYEPLAGRLQFYASFESGLAVKDRGHYVGAPPLTFSAGAHSHPRVQDHPQLAPGYKRPSNFLGLNMM